MRQWEYQIIRTCGVVDNIGGQPSTLELNKMGADSWRVSKILYSKIKTTSTSGGDEYTLHVLLEREIIPEE